MRVCTFVCGTFVPLLCLSLIVQLAYVQKRQLVLTIT